MVKNYMPREENQTRNYVEESTSESNQNSIALVCIQRAALKEIHEYYNRCWLTDFCMVGFFLWHDIETCLTSHQLNLLSTCVEGDSSSGHTGKYTKAISRRQNIRRLDIEDGTTKVPPLIIIIREFDPY